MSDFEQTVKDVVQAVVDERKPDPLKPSDVVIGEGLSPDKQWRVLEVGAGRMPATLTFSFSVKSGDWKIVRRLPANLGGLVSILGTGSPQQALSAEEVRSLVQHFLDGPNEAMPPVGRQAAPDEEE